MGRGWKIVTVVLVALALLFSVGCGSQRVSQVFVALPTPLTLPGSGGTLIMTLGARDPTTLDPALVADTTSSFVVRQLFSGLVRLDEQLEVQPDLAEDWQISADGKTYTFTLRTNARFADGTPITAEEVRYSLERATDPKLARFLPASVYLSDIAGVREKLAGKATSISGVQVVNPQTITITTDGPKSFFLAKLAHPTSFVVDRRRVEGPAPVADDGQPDPAGWTAAPNGSGPFEIETWRHDRQLDIKRNINFYRDLARLDRVRFLMGAAASNDLVLYEQGDIDLVGVPAYALARIQDPDSPFAKQLTSVPQLSLTYIGMNTALPPFDDPKVREAFTLLFDRAKLAEVTLQGAAQDARGILPPGLPGYNPELPAVEADFERARALIGESRYGSVEALPPVVAYGSWAGTLRELAEEGLGLTIEVRGYEDFGDYLDALKEGNLALFGTGWVADYPDPENFLAVLFGSGSLENHTGYANPQVDELLAQAAVEADEQKRYELYREAEQLILADAVVIPLTHAVEHMLVKPYVKGLTITPMGILDLSTVELVK